MALQDVISVIAKQMASQRTRSVSPLGSCRYRGENGSKCAVGALLTDQEARKCEMKGMYSVDRLHPDVSLRLTDLMPEIPRFSALRILFAFQTWHDGYGWDRTTLGLDELEGARQFADMLGDNPNVTEEAIAEMLNRIASHVVTLPVEKDGENK